MLVAVPSGAITTALTAVTGVEGKVAIDATNADTSLIHHSSFSNSRTVLADLFNLFETGNGPELRFGLRPVETEGGRHWEFKP